MAIHDPLTELEFRIDRGDLFYDEQTPSSIRFPNGSLCRIGHGHKTPWAGSLVGIVTAVALELHARSRR